MKMEGWIKLYRSIHDWEWADSPLTLALYVHLLAMANTSDGVWRGVTYTRGQVITSVSELSKTCGLTERQTRTCLERLKTTSNLTIKTTNKYSIITICKYDTYQSNKKTNDKQNDKQNANKRQTNDKQNDKPILIEEDKNVKNVKINISPLTPLWVERISAFGFSLTSNFEKYGECVADWLEYKKGRKQAYKTQGSFDALVKKLDRLAGGNPEKARAVIEESMSNNWAGLFEIQERQGTNCGGFAKPKRIDPIDSMKRVLGTISEMNNNNQTEEATWKEL